MSEPNTDLAALPSRAPLSVLRPKNVRQLYGNHVIYLHRKDNVFHLIFADHAPLETEERFGSAVGSFNPFLGKSGRWCLYEENAPAGKQPRIPISRDREGWYCPNVNLGELYAFIGDGDVCMSGLECPTHKEQQ